MTFKEWMGGKQRYDFEKMYDDYLRDLESQDQENKYPRDEAAEGGRIGFADGGSGESSGIYGLLKQGIKNIEKGGLDSLFGERVSLAGGGSAGQPPITAFPIIDKPDENLTAGISPTQNPFVSYAKQFDTFGGQAGAGIYKEKNMDPNFGIGFSREVGPGRFSGGVNYTPGMNPEADFRYIQQSPSGEFSAGLNYNDNQGPRAELQYRKEFKNGGLATMFRLK